MVDRQCAVFYANLHASAEIQFGGMDFRTHAVAGSGLHDAFGFVGGEEAAVAEHIDEFGQTLGSDCGQHVGDDMVDIFALTACVGAAHSVSAKECGAYGQRQSFGYARNHTQHF